MIVYRKCGYEQGGGQETTPNDEAQLDGFLLGVVQVAVPPAVAFLLAPAQEESTVERG